MKKVLLSVGLLLILVTLTGCEFNFKIGGDESKANTLLGEKSYECTYSSGDNKQSGYVIVKNNKLERYVIKRHYVLTDKDQYDKTCKSYKDTIESLDDNNKYDLHCDDEKKTIDTLEVYYMSTLDERSKSSLSGLLSYVKDDDTFDYEGWMTSGRNNGYTCQEG